MVRNVLLLSCLAGASAFSLAPSVGLRLRTDAAAPVARGFVTAARTAIPGWHPLSRNAGARVGRTRALCEAGGVGVVRCELVARVLVRGEEGRGLPEHIFLPHLTGIQNDIF